MPILSFSTDTIGEVGLVPRTVRIDTNDNFATITTANYLLPLLKMGFPLANTDAALVSYIGTGGTPITELFNISLTSSTVTLQAAANGALLPVTNGHFANFNGTNGQISDAGFKPSNASLANVSMASGTIASGNMPQFADISGSVSDSGVVANRVLYGNVGSPNPSANLFSIDIGVVFSQLSGGASATLVSSTALQRYRINTLWLLSGGTNFSGGGGDRGAIITDGTSTFSTIPAAGIQTLTNTQWGVTNLPFPAFAIDSPTQAGASLVIKYNGGTTDYTTGRLVIYGLIERIQ